MSFKALYLQKSEAGFHAGITDIDAQTLATEPLAEGDVLVRITHSTINYKDALAITNAGPVVRGWPMIAGIDGAGEVVASSHSQWQTGDTVLVNGWGLGETHWGCMAGLANLRGEWLVAIPDGFTAAQAMAVGTAGYTAMLCCLAIEEAGVRPSAGEVLVTGASGGVGSIAISILSSWGYDVIGSTGKMEQEAFLRQLGAVGVLDRRSLAEPGKPLQRERWAAVVDSVGSLTLANACAQTRYGGIVTACGLAQGMDFPASVAPFILRGVRLIGIDSVMCPIERRELAWKRLASDLDKRKLADITTTVGLADVPQRAADLLRGTLRGRTVVCID